MDIEKICELGRSVVRTEAQMIHSLVDRIDQKFAKACQYLYECKGRIAVMGVGKSGHISRKIAATLASTGSPAFFIHPSEAKHGDIGMLTPRDCLIAISNSGESDEIIAVLPVIKHLGIPLISLTGRPESTLAKAASVHLDVSVEKEACPLGLAPTSSTTVALVMGDALAMVLLEQRGFTEKDFALSHPGGILGRRLLLQVEALMHQHEAIPMISHQASLKEALMEMTQKKLGMTTIVDEAGQLIGVFTDGDVRRAFDKNIDIQTTIQELMTHSPKTIPKEMLAVDALSLMESHQITALVIANEKQQPIGILHIHDLLRAGVL